jgi:hypothetical protein
VIGLGDVRAAQETIAGRLHRTPVFSSAALADVTGAAVVVNEEPDSEQIDSLRLGLAGLPDDAAAVALVIQAGMVGRLERIIERRTS